MQPHPLADQWPAERLEKAKRNYAVDFVRNAIVALMDTIGETATEELAGRAARLTGLQYLQETMQLVGSSDGGLGDAAEYLERMMQGMGDGVSRKPHTDNEKIELQHEGLRIVRGLSGQHRDMVLKCWLHLWRGALASYRAMKRLDAELKPDHIVWHISELQA
ncbi:MAG: hypothetical protein QGF90_12285 [Gammaproteobacteria bacterium]|nr:hypothetical protein [Gammaproteobacteria bacterium]